MEHTPGPWKYRERDIDYCYVIVKPHVGAIASVFDTTDDIPAKPTEGEANAKLIAAAPDLLEACELSDDGDANILYIAANELQRAGKMEYAIKLRKKVQAEKAAIAKARGN